MWCAGGEPHLEWPTPWPTPTVVGFDLPTFWLHGVSRLCILCNNESLMWIFNLLYYWQLTESPIFRCTAPLWVHPNRAVPAWLYIMTTRRRSVYFGGSPLSALFALSFCYHRLYVGQCIFVCMCFTILWNFELSAIPNVGSSYLQLFMHWSAFHY